MKKWRPAFRSGGTAQRCGYIMTAHQEITGSKPPPVFLSESKLLLNEDIVLVLVLLLWIKAVLLLSSGWTQRSFRASSTSWKLSSLFSFFFSGFRMSGSSSSVLRVNPEKLQNVQQKLEAFLAQEKEQKERAQRVCVSTQKYERIEITKCRSVISDESDKSTCWMIHDRNSLDWLLQIYVLLKGWASQIQPFGSWPETRNENVS